MKAFGIYILTDRTIRILLEFARNSELNEIAYREVLDDEKRKQGLPVHHPDNLWFLGVAKGITLELVNQLDTKVGMDVA